MSRIKITGSKKKQLQTIEALLGQLANNSKLRKHLAKVLYNSKQACKDILR